jgi:hypothetical protein
MIPAKHLLQPHHSILYQMLIELSNTSSHPISLKGLDDKGRLWSDNPNPYRKSRIMFSDRRRHMVQQQQLPLDHHPQSTEPSRWLVAAAALASAGCPRG